MVAWAEILSEISGVATDQSLWKKSGYGANKLPEVVELQKWLNANGFNAGAEDGVYGKGTANAVRAFQQKQGLAVDGDAGPGTLKAMQSGAQAQPQAEPNAPAEPQGQAQQNNPNADASAGTGPTQPAGTTNAKAGTPAQPPTQPEPKPQTGQTQQPQGTAPEQPKPDTQQPQGTAPKPQTTAPDQATPDKQPQGANAPAPEQPTAPDQATPDKQPQGATAPAPAEPQDKTSPKQPAAQDDDEDGIPSDEYLNAPDEPGDRPARKQKETWNINGKEMTKNDINKRLNALLRKARAGGVVNAGFQFNSSIGKILHEQLSSAETKELQSIVNAVKDSRYYQLFLNRRTTLQALQDAGIQGIPGKPDKRDYGNQKSATKYYKTDPKTGKEVEIDKDEADAMQAKQDKFMNTKRDADGKDDFDRALDSDDDMDMDSAMQKSRDKIAAMRKGGADVKTTSSSTSTSTSNVTTTGGSSNTTKTSGGGSTTRFSKVMRATKETEKLRAEKDEIRRKMNELGDKSDGFEYTQSPEYKALKKELNTYRGSDGKIAKSKEMVHPGGEMDSNGNIKYYTKTGKWDGEQYDPKRKNDLRDGEDMTQLNRIVELAGIESDFNFDVIDDAHIHMKNDRDFYRKEYYPAMCKIAELTKGRKVFDPKMIVMPLVDKGVNSYCKKYNLAKMPDEVFKKDHRQALYDKIYSEEIEQINNGEYT